MKLTKHKAFAFCGVLSGALGIAVLLLASSLDPAFVWFSDYISELALGPAALLFNAGLIIGGLLAIPFTFAVARAFHSEFGWRILLLSVIALIGIGLFPTPHPLHLPVSAAFFVLLAAGELVLGHELRKHPRVGVLSELAGVLSFASIAFFSPAAEPVPVFTGLAWVFAIGVWMLRKKY